MNALEALRAKMAAQESMFNDEQQRFISTALSRKDCILIGSAGTGKTTSIRGYLDSYLNGDKYIPTLGDVDGHKYLKTEMYGVLFVSYTRRAVDNIKRNVPANMKNNCLTIHKLLEYKPHKFLIEDPETGEMRNTMQYLPSRTKERPLPEGIHTIVFEEASMISVELFELVMKALPHKEVQLIFIGDIQQLLPVFGQPVLGKKMVELKDSTVLLHRVYRQALESPIIRLAQRILSGKSITAPAEWQTQELVLHPWKKKISEDNAIAVLSAFIKSQYEQGKYDPSEHMILCPFNKGVGTIELNKHVAQMLAKKFNRKVHEVVAGFNTHYLAEGDRVLVDKAEAEIIRIKRNPSYLGKRPQPAATTLDYWGYNPLATQEIEQESEEDIDAYLDALTAGNIEDKVNSSSHIITVRILDTGIDVELTTAAKINDMLLAYVLTVHKAQGSEWDKVYLLLHHTHNTMIQRELLYTAVTRAAKELYVICEPDHFVKGVQRQRIPGNSLEEKLEFFKTKFGG